MPRRISAAAVFLAILGLASCGGRSSTGPLLPVAQRITASALWIPRAGSSYAIQYGGTKLDTSVAASIYDVDGFDTSAATVASLHAKGRRVVCYIDVGTWENWRPDAGAFPKSVLGKPDGGWPGERWLDIRRLSVLEPLMSARFQICKSKGFDAVDPDNIDGYTNRTGFRLTAAEQLRYDRWVARTIHGLGMSVAQKNDGAQIGALRASFDWAVTEQCYSQHWCGLFASYTNENRLVVDIEYGITNAAFRRNVCPAAARYRETALLKHLSLNAWAVRCPVLDPP